MSCQVAKDIKIYPHSCSDIFPHYPAVKTSFAAESGSGVLVDPQMTTGNVSSTFASYVYLRRKGALRSNFQILNGSCVEFLLLNPHQCSPRVF
jgi:hypothetical protein